MKRRLYRRLLLNIRQDENSEDIKHYVSLPNDEIWMAELFGLIHITSKEKSQISDAKWVTAKLTLKGIWYLFRHFYDERDEMI